MSAHIGLWNYPQGALLKDPRTGEQMSVHFANMRKLSMDEFITLLPTHFDNDILKTLGLFAIIEKETQSQ